jgi:hypothetical protein
MAQVLLTEPLTGNHPPAKLGASHLDQAILDVIDNPAKIRKST